MTATSPFCARCGVQAEPNQKFCTECGASLSKIESNAPVPNPGNDWGAEFNAPTKIVWVDRSPILGANIATKQLGLMVVLSLLIMQVLVGTMGWFVNGEFIVLPWFVFAIGGGVFVMLMLFAILILGNSMNTEVTVTEKGLGYRLGARSRGLSRVAIAAGTLAGSAGTAGSGMLAASRESGFIPWQEVDRIRIRKRRRSIALYGPVLPLIEVVCTPQVFTEVVALIEQHVQKVETVT